MRVAHCLEVAAQRREPMNPTCAQQAMTLAKAGRPMEGLSMLREAQAREEP